MNRTDEANGNELQVNEKELLRLYAPWDEPNQHRQGRETVAEGRRPSHLAVVHALREAVSVWRESGYEGASETSRLLLMYWFEGEHLHGNDVFRYYFCQREAIETLVYLYEVQRTRCISDLITDYSIGQSELFPAFGIPPRENAWPKYAFKLATGTGKTMCMSLAIVWSYFHALRESNSEMTTCFLVIAPGLTVYERLLDDFGKGKTFSKYPLIPPAWKKNWQLNVVEQNDPGGAGQGVLYLTNIHKLYPKSEKRQGQYYSFMGPPVTPTDSIDLAEELRERIAKEPRLMILNDEAHHIWNPDLAWSQAIEFFHEEGIKRHGNGLVAQLDFSATPKDQNGTLFKHVVCDTPLGEAVDAGIVKVPIIGEADMSEAVSEDAAERYRAHLEVGYDRWLKSFKEWEGTGRNPLLFVMCENTEAADSIFKCLNADPRFEKLNGKTLNLHTNLKGKVKGGVFIEDEKNMTEADLKWMRELSRKLDSDSSPYTCVVSVLMLREGWDVKNVTTIVPLRPFTAASKILPEQTLGRGLRRMTPPIEAQVVETVVVIDHPEFRNLYEETLGHEGVTPIVVSPDTIPRTVISIYPKKNGALEIELPCMSDAYSRNLKAVEDISWADVEAKCSDMPKLSLETASTGEYKGHHLLTGGLVEWMKYIRPLLNNGWTAISYFVRQLEHACGLPPILHPIIAPLMERFLTDMLFEEKVSLTDARLLQRLSDMDVTLRIAEVFKPLILDKVIQEERRRHMIPDPVLLSQWKPYAFTVSQRNPAILGNKTLFNLVPCHRRFEAEFVKWLDRAPDVVAFAKNQGPEALSIDYLNADGRLSRYIPDFFVRDSSKAYFLVETKGFPDGNAEQKAKAGHLWCQSVSAAGIPWRYLFVHQNDWERFGGQSLASLVAMIEQGFASVL